MTLTAQLTIYNFLDELAARNPTPGGGGAAALTGAQAAALLSMVSNFTLGNKKYAEVEVEMQACLSQSEALRGELLALADSDVTAFTAVAAGYALPRNTDQEKTTRTAAIQAGLKQATQVPFTIAEKCLAVLQLTALVGAKGNANVVSDAATAFYLSAAALHSALVNVNINLKSIKDAAYVATESARRDALLAAAHQAHAAAKAACEGTLEVTL